jgi:hypothetical protein
LRPFYTVISFFLFPVCFLLLHQQSAAQVKISGTVYDISRKQTVSSVSVISSSGAGTATDSNGVYSIIVRETDSIWFSYLNKPTPKFPVTSIANTNAFDISLHVPVTELREVRVRPRDYRLDSIQNRLTYAKAFEFQKPGIRLSSPPSSGFGVGLDLDELINMFNFKRNRRMLAFQRRLVQEEQDKAIDHRFTKALVKKITHLEGAQLDEFMIRYRPSYNFTMTVTDYEFAEYIKLAWLEFKKRK